MIKNALKKLLPTFMMMGGVLVCIVFSGCESFMNGADLKTKVDEQISLANAKEDTVLVSVRNTQYGIIQQEGTNYFKAGVPFTLNFSVNDDYVLDKWIAYFYGTNPEDSDNLLDENYVVFSDSYSQLNSETISVTIKQLNETGKTVVISPLVNPRPYVVSLSCADKTIYPLETFSLKFNDETLNFNLHKGPIYLCKPESYIYELKSKITGSFIDREQIEINIKDMKDSTYYEDGNYKFIVTQNKNNLYFESVEKIYGDVGRTCSEKGNRYYFYDSASSEYIKADDWELSVDMVRNDYRTRYVEIVIHPSIENSAGVTANKKVTFGFSQANDVDTISPLVLSAKFFLPDQGFVLGYGLGHFIKSTDQNIFTIDDVVSDSLTDIDSYKNDYSFINNSADYIAAKRCRERFQNPDYYPQRIKDRMIFYTMGGDIKDNNPVPNDENNVDKMVYYLTYISDNSGTIKNEQKIMYNRSISSTMTGYEFEIDYINSIKEGTQYKHKINYPTDYQSKALEKLYESEHSVDELLLTGGIAVDFNFNNYKFPDGLYCLETCFSDARGNYGNGYLLSDKYKTGYFGQYETIDWVKHNTQFYFVKDTVPPATTAADFEMPVTYWYNAESIKNLAIPMDTDWFRSEDRKIVDAGNEAYNSLFTYRICSVTPFDSDPDGLEKSGWLKTYETDYVFEDVYGSGNWGAEGLSEGSHNIYAYVKDDVNNVGELITLEDAFGYDNTAPVAEPRSLDPYKVYSTWISLFVQTTEKLSGIKQIKYDVDCTSSFTTEVRAQTDSSGIYKALAFSDDTENKIITLDNSVNIDEKLFGISLTGCTADNTNSVTFTFIDDAGNESEPVVFTIE